MKQELLRRRRKTEKAENRNSKRKLDRYDHGGKGRIDAARGSGRSRAATELVRQQRVKVERQDRRLDGMAAVKLQEYDFKFRTGCVRGEPAVHVSGGRADAGEGQTAGLSGVAHGNGRPDRYHWWRQPRQIDWRFLRRLIRERWNIRDGILKTGYWE